MLDLKALHKKLCDAIPKIAARHITSAKDDSAKGTDGLDFVTSVDFAVQADLEQVLSQLLPDARVLAEEGYDPNSDATGLTWLVDPLDGTVNFVSGLPVFAVAVVLLQDGEPLLAAVYDIPRDNMYSAIAGQGAFIGDKPIAPIEHPAKLAVMSSGLIKDLAEISPDTLLSLMDQYKMRNLGSQALHLCYVAAGFVSFVASREAKGWDDLAGALIATEAGCRYGTYSVDQAKFDENQKSVCAQPAIFDKLRQQFATALTDSRPGGK